jgi:hypothetical protein
MLDRCDRVQVAVADRHRAASGYRRLFDAEVARDDVSRHLGAKRLVLALGESEIELCEPDGAGRTQDFLARWGESIMTAGYATVDVERLARRLEQLGVSIAREEDQLYLGPPDTPGVPFVISPSTYRPRVGRASFLCMRLPIPWSATGGVRRRSMPGCSASIRPGSRRSAAIASPTKAH